MKHLLFTTIFVAFGTSLWADDCKTAKKKAPRNQNQVVSLSKAVSAPKTIVVNEKDIAEQPLIIVVEPSKGSKRAGKQIYFLYDYGFWWTPVK